MNNFKVAVASTTNSAKIYNNFYFVTFLSLVGSVFMLYALKSFHFGEVVQHFIPFGDLWVSLTVLIVICIIGSRRIVIRRKVSWQLSVVALVVLILGIIVKVSFSQAFEIYYADYSNSGSARRNMYMSPYTWLVSIAWCAFLIYAYRRTTVACSAVWKKNLPRVALLVATLSALVASQYNLLVSVSPYADNPINLGVVIMPIINLFYGAFPPLDVQSQYGLYAYFLVPILKVIHLNIFTISLLFAVLFFICFIAIFRFTYAVTGSSIFAFTTMIASFYLNTSFGNLWPSELYFQYRPIRMLAPCIALLFFLWYQSRQCAIRRVIILICLSLLVLWNSDSGIPTMAAFVIANAFNDFFLREGRAPKPVARFIYFGLEGVMILLAVLALFVLILFIVDNAWVTPAIFFEPMTIWRKSQGFFTSWSQPIILPALVFCVAIAQAISRGFAGLWGRQEMGLLLVGLLGVGISTYGTLNPQSAALTAYLLPVALVQLATLFTGTSQTLGNTGNASRFFIPILCILPVCFLATSFLFHIKDNFGYTSIPTIAEIVWPSPTSDKALSSIPGKSAADVDYIKVKDLTGPIPPTALWEQKAAWLKDLAYLNTSASKGRVFIASVHDHFLYASMHRSSPVRLVNFVHIPIFRNWPLLFDKTQAKDFDYIIIDQTYLLRNNDAKGPGNFDTFLELVKKNYYLLEEKNIGFDWHYPFWKASTIYVYGTRRIVHSPQKSSSNAKVPPILGIASLMKGFLWGSIVSF